MGYNEFIFNILVCFGLSFVIGIERQYRKRPVGLRTSILVAIGSFLFVSYSHVVGGVDESRIAAQVVTGIGFLGAGVILKDGKNIRGLTTAATLWCASAIGVLCAGGALKEATFGTLIILFSNTLLRYINQLVSGYSTKRNTHTNYEIIIKTKESDFNKVKGFVLDFISANKDNSDLISFDTKDSIDGIEICLNISVSKLKNHIIEILNNDINKKFKLISYNVNKLKDVVDIDEYDEL